MAEAPFTRTYHARWGDMDFNAHMRNTAFLDLAADVRMTYFQEHGFPMRRFEQLRIGPVILRDELEYFREVRLLEPVSVTLLLAGLSEDASRFRMRNEFFTAERKLAARVTSNGAWLDLTARKISPPPEELAALTRAIEKSPDYEPLPAPARS